MEEIRNPECSWHECPIFIACSKHLFHREKAESRYCYSCTWYGYELYKFWYYLLLLSSYPVAFPIDIARMFFGDLTCLWRRCSGKDPIDANRLLQTRLTSHPSHPRRHWASPRHSAIVLNSVYLYHPLPLLWRDLCIQKVELHRWTMES